MPTPCILHLDVDAFAVSVARVLDPGLEGRTILVGHEAGGRGVVACACYAARRAGVRAGMLLSRARRRLPEAVFVPSDPLRWEQFSDRLLEFLAGRAPLVERAALDDFFLDLTGCARLLGEPSRWAAALAADVRRATGLPVSMGLATNKFVAHIAARIAKPGRLCIVPPGCESAFLEPVSLTLVPGLGRSAIARLREMGLYRAGQLAALGPELLGLLLGPRGSLMHRRICGMDHEPVTPTALHRFLHYEYDFSGDTADPALVEAGAALLAQRLAGDLRRHRLLTACADLFLVYSDGVTASRRLSLVYASDADADFVAAARTAARAGFRRRVRVRRLVLRAPFEVAADSPPDLFADLRRRRLRAFHEAVDAVRRRHGFESLVSLCSLPAR
ncbi:MAG: hypothetical protein N2111_10900 [Candidatus Sumerlaeaceae bacterium]|nr:hypothetical protein [Candidatus Sumerlaeaceae bacterium]